MAARGLLLMGQCMPCIKQNASKIRIRRMELDKNLNMVRCVVVLIGKKFIYFVFLCSTLKRIRFSLPTIRKSCAKLAM